MASDPTCNTCFQASCRAQSQACADDADCDALITCVGGCSDQACVNACAQQTPGGVGLYNEFASCLSSSCKTERGR